MSANASITFDWGDDTYKFRLGLGEVRELQDRTKAGPYRLFTRIGARDWLVDDLREIIRLGLIGGGMKPPDALKLVRTYVDARPALESVEPSQRILGAYLAGVPDDPVGKPKAEEARKETAQTAESPSPQSTP